jgi:[ribosomal protein S5]-alanine N-acetyltransferase
LSCEDAVVLIGERVQLRPVREADLATFVTSHFDIASRGDYFPARRALGVRPPPPVAETGFWERGEGTL